MEESLVMKVILLFSSLSISAICSPPNVLFVVVDDLRPSLGCYGDKNAFTPNIDKLASKSFIFTKTFAQQALCAPSRNSFMTSRRPDSLHHYDLFTSYWRQEIGNFTTIPQHFKEHGYYTKSIGKIFHPSATSNLTDDFPYSWSVPAYHPPTEQYERTYLCPSPFGNIGGSVICPVDLEDHPMKTLPDIENKQEAIKFLSNWKEETRGQPYFLALGFHKPHEPIKFPEGYLGYHPPNQVTLPELRTIPPLLPTVAMSTFIDARLCDDVIAYNLSYPFGTLPDDYLKRLIRNYNAAVTYIDDLLGQVLQHVDDDTIIVLTGDHGFSLGENGFYGKYTNYEIATRVPLIIRAPSLKSNSQVTIPVNVELVDLFPTLVELTQVTGNLCTCNENSMDTLCTEGRSLVTTMINAINASTIDTKSRAVFSQCPRPRIFPTLINGPFEFDMPLRNETNIMGYSMSTGRYRYAEWVAFDNHDCKPNWNISYATELYDHFYDDYEGNNLAGNPDYLNMITDFRKKLILGWRYD